LKLASSRWRVDYQREMQRRYRETINMVEERFSRELLNVMDQLSFFEKMKIDLSFSF